MTNDLEAALADAVERGESVEGLIRTNEMRLLFLAAALPTAEGEVLEIGSYKGRSTVVLARGALWAGQQKIVACDPFTSPSSTDPDEPSYDDFCAAIECHGLVEHVEVHRERSADLARAWRRPIRLLWIDGDHTYAGVKSDVGGFFPHLAEGALAVFHDVGRSRFPGPTRCFIEDVLLSDRFGACGLTDYTAWAQRIGAGGLEAHRETKSRLYRFLSARLAQQVFGTKLGLVTRWGYRRFRKARGFEAWIRAAAGGKSGGTGS